MNLRQQQAISLLDTGLSIVPIRPDGSKAPSVKWESYQHTHATSTEVQHWFSSMHSGIGIIGGSISGDLEILDFDDAEVFEPWRNLSDQCYEDLVARLVIVQTPTGGYHVYYRAHGVEGNQKLARSWHHEKPGQVKVETRGEGGYVLSPYCHPDCHPLHRSYQLIQGDLSAIPLISQQAREVLLNSARCFDEVVDIPRQTRRHVGPHEGTRPGDDFAMHTSWQEILEPCGWRVVGHRGETIFWKRPGKDERGWSATTGHDGKDILYVFSTNSHPFEANHAYAKFTAFTLLNHRGDFHAAASAVA